jgi:hypothetical protein
MSSHRPNATPVPHIARRWPSPDLIILGLALIGTAAVLWASSARNPSLSRIGGTWKLPFWR